MRPNFLHCRTETKKHTTHLKCEQVTLVAPSNTFPRRARAPLWLVIVHCPPHTKTGKVSRVGQSEVVNANAQLQLCFFEGLSREFTDASGATHVEQD